MIDFIVMGLPRSATTWCANWLTTDKTFCLHDPRAEPKTLALRKALERRGVYGAVFCAPATAKNRSLVRLTLNSGLSKDDIGRLLDACDDMRGEVDLEGWSSTRRLRRLTLV